MTEEVGVGCSQSLIQSSNKVRKATWEIGWAPQLEEEGVLALRTTQAKFEAFKVLSPVLLLLLLVLLLKVNI